MPLSFLFLSCTSTQMGDQAYGTKYTMSSKAETHVSDSEHHNSSLFPSLTEVFFTTDEWPGGQHHQSSLCLPERQTPQSLLWGCNNKRWPGLCHWENGECWEMKGHCVGRSQGQGCMRWTVPKSLGPIVVPWCPHSRGKAMVPCITHAPLCHFSN